MFNIVIADPETRELMRITQGGQWDYNSKLYHEQMLAEAKGRAAGIKEGEAKGKAEIVCNMLKSNVSISDISKFTGMSEEEIRALI